MGAKGFPKTAGSGRKKGSINKDSDTLRERAEALGINPFEILLLFASGDWERLGYKTEVIVKEGQSFMNEEFVIQPAVRAKAAAEACRYIYPQLKSIEHSGSIEENLTVVSVNEAQVREALAKIESDF